MILVCIRIDVFFRRSKVLTFIFIESILKYLNCSEDDHRPTLCSKNRFVSRTSLLTLQKWGRTLILLLIQIHSISDCSSMLNKVT